MTDLKKLIERLRDYDECNDDDIDQAADELEKFLLMRKDFVEVYEQLKQNEHISMICTCGYFIDDCCHGEIADFAEGILDYISKETINELRNVYK